jgi:hypothetical protein
MLITLEKSGGGGGGGEEDDELKGERDGELKDIQA